MHTKTKTLVVIKCYVAIYRGKSSMETYSRLGRVARNAQGGGCILDLCMNFDFGAVSQSPVRRMILI